MSDDQTPPPSNVLTLHSTPPDPQTDENAYPPVQPRLVQDLEEWLLLARTGELQSLVLAGEVVYHQGPTQGHRVVRFGSLNTAPMEAAGWCEQHAFNLRLSAAQSQFSAEAVGDIPGPTPPEGWALQEAHTDALELTMGEVRVTVARVGLAALAVYVGGKAAPHAADPGHPGSEAFDDQQRMELATRWASTLLVSQHLEDPREAPVVDLGDTEGDVPTHPGVD